MVVINGFVYYSIYIYFRCPMEKPFIDLCKKQTWQYKNPII